MGMALFSGLLPYFTRAAFGCSFFALQDFALIGCMLGDRRAGTSWNFCGVEVWRGGLGEAYRLPTLSSVGASLAPPCFRFHTPLIEPDVRICRIRLSEKTHAIAEAIACDAACDS